MALPSENSNSPSGVAIDSKDNLYVADTDNDRIQKFTLSTILKVQIENLNSIWQFEYKN